MNENQKQEIKMPFNVDDFFTTQEQRDEDKKEKVEEIDIDLIDNFKNHPFNVEENDELKALEESIKVSGVLSPVIVRRKDDNRYEMLSGHRRKLASQLLGLNKLPCIIKDLSDDEATIFMVDSNLQREKLLPSEKAFAYKMKYDALKHQRKIPANQLDSSVRQVVAVVRSDDLLGDEQGDSGRQVQRYIRLTFLIPELLTMVDNNELDLKPKMAMSPAVEISFLKENEQLWLLDVIEKNESTPSHAQAITFKEMSKCGTLTKEEIEKQMMQLKPNQVEKFKIDEKKLYTVIPKNVKRENIEEFVLKACEFYSKHLKNRELER